MALKEADTNAQSGKTIQQRDGYAVYDWQYYTRGEKLLFHVEDTGEPSTIPLAEMPQTLIFAQRTALQDT